MAPAYDPWTGPTDEAQRRAFATYQQAVRDSCAQAGADECDYWFTDPQAAVTIRPACIADQLDQIETDLAAARQNAEYSDPPY